MNGFTDIVSKTMEVSPDEGDYTGEDGLLYCGSCRTPKQFRMDKPPMEGRLLPRRCQCEQAQYDKEEAERKRRKHLQAVEELKRRGFTDSKMREWTFANDNGKCPQMELAHFYAEHWETMCEENIGYLLWGKVGTGKSYFAGCIANALMEQEVPVRMTNFALILNDLTASFEGRNEYIERLCRFSLLIIDDFGMERGTEYGLEQVYNVIDSRYRSGKPLIVTTNLTLDSLQNPQDTAHARIYDRLLEMCAPILFTGENFRRETAQAKLSRLKELLKRKEQRMTENPSMNAKEEARRPDCVTEVRMGNTVLVVSGYFKKDAAATAADKMMKVLEAEAAANTRTASAS